MTKLTKPRGANTLIYQGSLTIFNSTSTKNVCKNLNINRDKDLVKALITISGLQPCDKIKQGLRCLNGTVMKFRDSEKTIRLMTMTSKHDDRFRIVDIVYFEQGQSCVDATFVMKKY